MLYHREYKNKRVNRYWVHESPHPAPPLPLSKCCWHWNQLVQHSGLEAEGVPNNSIQQLWRPPQSSRKEAGVTCPCILVHTSSPEGPWRPIRHGNGSVVCPSPRSPLTASSTWMSTQSEIISVTYTKDNQSPWQSPPWKPAEGSHTHLCKTSVVLISQLEFVSQTMHARPKDIYTCVKHK